MPKAIAVLRVMKAGRNGEIAAVRVTLWKSHESHDASESAVGHWSIHSWSKPALTPPCCRCSAESGQELGVERSPEE